MSYHNYHHHYYHHYQSPQVFIIVKVASARGSVLVPVCFLVCPRPFALSVMSSRRVKPSFPVPTSCPLPTSCVDVVSACVPFNTKTIAHSGPMSDHTSPPPLGPRRRNQHFSNIRWAKPFLVRHLPTHSTTSSSFSSTFFFIATVLILGSFCLGKSFFCQVPRFVPRAIVFVSRCDKITSFQSFLDCLFHCLMSLQCFLPSQSHNSHFSIFPPTLLVPSNACGYPGSPAHASVILSTEKIAPGTIATYTCDNGYELLGPPRRACNTNGTWTPAGIPFCGKCRRNLFDIYILCIPLFLLSLVCL